MIAMEYMEDVSKHEILEAISLLAENVQDVSDQMVTKDHLESRLFQLGDLLTTKMVTKSYLDDKMADLRGDLIALTRKSNVKLSVLVESLVKEGSLKRNTADLILAMEPFEQR